MKDNQKFCARCGCENDVELSKENVEIIESVAEDTEQYPQMEKPRTINRILTKRNINLAGIISSVVIIILGLASMCGVFGDKIATTEEFSSGVTDYTSHFTYGGDAYTGMQNASADASNNAAVAAENVVITNNILYDAVQGINALQRVVSGTVGVLILAVGIFGLCYFSLGFVREKEAIAEKVND